MAASAPAIPTRLRLSEYSTLPHVNLNLSQLSAIQSMSPAPLAISPNATDPALFDLTAGSYVGVVRMTGLEIEIRPKLSINRLLFLLSYSMNPSNWHAIRAVFEERESIFEAIIPGFAFQVRQALRRGVLQGYRTEEDALITVRGRIRTSEQIRRRYGLAPPIELRFDEFTEDIAENRLLKAAIHRLTRLRIRSEKIRQSLREFDLALQHVSLIECSPRALPEINWTRLNERYRPAVELARLILRATSFDLGTGRVAASAFLIDMNRVFEDFVTCALGEALRPHGLSLSAQDRRLHLDKNRDVRLIPDISCWQYGRCQFVGDVKYKRTIDNQGTHPDLYQLLAYIVAADLPEGVLIYAKGEDEPRRHQVVHLGRTLQVIALDLEAAPEDLLHQIEGIAERILLSSRRSAVVPVASGSSD